MRLLEIVKFVLPVRISMPVTETPPVLKKSKILLLLVRLFWLLVLFPVVPTAEIHFVGRLIPAGPILLFAIMLVLLATTFVRLATVVLNNILPPAGPRGTVDDRGMLRVAL